MALSFDPLPIYDDLIQSERVVPLSPSTSERPYRLNESLHPSQISNLSRTWQIALTNLMDTLQSYLSQTGIFVPQITTTLRDSLQNVQNGQLIYNTTDNKFQGYENGTWVNLV